MFYGNPSAPSVTAVAGTFFGPNSSTDSVATGGAGGVGNSQRGFRFSPNEDLLVTAFGKDEPTGTTRYVTLFNFVTQAIVTQQQVSGPAGQYSYQNLTNPIWITQGTQYLLELYQGSADGYYYGTSSQVGQHLTYYDMRYCNSCTQNTFPTNTLSNYQYGYPDLWYFTKRNVTPAPTYAMGTALTVNAGSGNVICQGSTVMIGGTATGGTPGYTYSWAPASSLNSSSISQPNASPTTTTTYTEYVTDLCGTSTSSTVTVTVNNLPNVTAGANPGTSICTGSSVTLNGGGAVSYNWSNSVTDNVAFTPSATTTYTVTGTDANGCSNTNTITVTVNPLPAVGGNASPSSTLCEGSMLTLSGTGASTYSWSGGVTDNVPFTALNSGTYTVTGTDANGCSNTGTVSITVNQLPVVAYVESQSNVCINWAPITLTPGSPANGTYSGTAVSGNTFDPATAGSGTFDVIYSFTDLNGCTNADTSQITVDLCTGIQLSSSQTGFEVFPNPFNNQLTIGVTSGSGEATLYNATGQEVMHLRLNEGKNTIDTKELSAGAYFVRVKTVKGTFDLQVIKSK
jgi:hypothetical protein